MAERKMPLPVNLGSHMQSTIGTPIHHWQQDETPNTFGYRSVMGYFLPSWQRGLVWSREQQIKLIESAWLGLNIGTYTLNRSKVYGGPLDNLLIDGQQRMNALECYLEDQFPVFGFLWSEVTDADRRGFEVSRHFSCYITASEDEAYLRNYYNMTNFGGVAHKEGDRA
jgi:hypothetical protein